MQPMFVLWTHKQLGLDFQNEGRVHDGFMKHSDSHEVD